jgi:hypothetical protein
MNERYFGIEVECIVNKDIVDIPVNSYHSDSFDRDIQHWAATSDSSLSCQRKFKNEYTCEFVSKKLKFSEWKKGFDSFKKALQNNKNVEFNEVIDINNTCGCHIHFSTDNKRENTLITPKAYEKLRENMFKRMETEMPMLYRAFKSQYFRSYSKKLKEELLDKGDRGLEINYSAINKGVEWRSFNLMGVETWEEFYNIVRIGLEELNKMLVSIESNEYKERMAITITKDTYDKIYNSISVMLGD